MKLFLYSNTYNGIYVFEKTYVSKEPLLIFPKSSIRYCIKDFAINGDLAILGCDGKFSEFSQNGLKKSSIPLKIIEPFFLIPLGEDCSYLTQKAKVYQLQIQEMYFYLK